MGLATTPLFGRLLDEKVLLPVIIHVVGSELGLRAVTEVEVATGIASDRSPSILGHKEA